MKIFSTDPDIEADGTPAHERIFLHSKESSINSGDRNPNHISVQEEVDEGISSRGRSKPSDTSRLMNMSLHGSMIANFLIKKAHEDIEY